MCVQVDILDIPPYHHHIDTHTDGQEARRRREMSLLQRQRKSISKWVGRQLSSGLAALAPCVPSALTSCLPSLPRAESWVVLDLEGAGEERAGPRERDGDEDGGDSQSGAEGAGAGSGKETWTVVERVAKWWAGWRGVDGGEEGKGGEAGAGAGLRCVHASMVCYS